MPEDLTIPEKSIRKIEKEQMVEFCDTYKACFSDSYSNYTALKNERLFVVTPTFIEKWLYIEGAPCIESYDIENKKYMLEKYCGI